MHPLDPINAAEMAAVFAYVKTLQQFRSLSTSQKPNNVVFVQCALKEPNKNYVKSWTPGQPLNRVADVLIYRASDNTTYQFYIGLDNAPTYTLISFKQLEGIIPAMNQNTLPPSQAVTVAKATALALSNEQIIKALEKRGFTADDLSSGRIRPFALPFEADFILKKKDCKCQCDFNIAVKCQCSSHQSHSCKGPPQHRYIPFEFSNHADSNKFVDPFSTFTFVQGLIFIVDATTQKIFRVVDDLIYPNPKIDQTSPERLLIPHKNPLKPLLQTMPSGQSFTFVNNLITWDNWKIRFSHHPRNGVQLYQIKYTDNGDRSYRDILYKLSIGDATNVYVIDEDASTWIRSSISPDASRYPLGHRLIRTVLGRDAPSYSTLIDFPVPNPDGTVSSSLGKQSIAIYEQDNEVLLRPTEVFDQTSPNYPFNQMIVRDRELCIRFTFSGNVYLWTFTYYFRLDGSIRTEVSIGGRLLLTANGDPNDSTRRVSSDSGVEVVPQYIAQNHHHLYNWRLDFDIDGEKNSIVETNQYRIFHDRKSNRKSNVEEEDRKSLSQKLKEKKKNPSLPGPYDPDGPPVGENRRAHEHDKGRFNVSEAVKGGPSQDCQNPCGNGVNYVDTVLKTELEAIRNYNFKTNRAWAVINPHKTNYLGHHIGYAVIPGVPNGSLLALDDSIAGTHLRYGYAHLHVTKYHEDEQSAIGTFSLQQPSDVGLGLYTSNNEKIENEDIVVWFTTIFAHEPHTEDFPWISNEFRSLRIVPHNFFNVNPGVNVVTPNI